MDLDGGGTIDAEELEGPLLSTGMVTNHKELNALMNKIATGGGEITFWEFLEAFKPKAPGKKLKEGEPDLAKLRYMLATAENETLNEAFQRDLKEDGLSDAEGDLVNLYVSRAEHRVRNKLKCSGITSEIWFERMYKGRGGREGMGTAKFSKDKPLGEADIIALAAKADAERAAEVLKKDSYLTLTSRIGMHRRRFLMATIMQEKERYVNKTADLSAALRGAEARRDEVETKLIKDALKKMDNRHNRRMDRLAATKIVVSKERKANGSDNIYGEESEEEEEEGEEEEGEEEEGESEEETNDEAVDGREEGGGVRGSIENNGEDGDDEESEDELMPWQDPEALAEQTKFLDSKMPRVTNLLSALKRFVSSLPSPAPVFSSFHLNHPNSLTILLLHPHPLALAPF